MSFRTQFRDKQEWLKSTNGCIDLNTSSDVAAKEYDASLTQLCGWYEDQSLGGLEGSVERMLRADNDFVLGRAFELELNLMGGLNAPRLDKDLAGKLEDFNKLVERKRSSISDQEALHAQVVNLWATSQLKQAGKVLEKLATLYPEDVSAVKMAQDTYFFLGQSMAMRNSVASCLARLRELNGDEKSPRNPLQGYVHGMFAFALEESNQYPQAELQALKALALIPRDTWAIHNYAHCLEMQAKSTEGLKWMLGRQPDWEPCQSLACHQYWHTALFHINNNNFDEAVALLDNEVLTRCVQSCSSLDLHDAASMVYRMELVDLFGKTKGEGAKLSDRWSGVYGMCKPHKGDHLIGFNDAHYMMSYLGMADMDTARELIESIDETPSLNEGATVVKPLLEAMYQFKLGAYDKCVDLLEPIRHEIVKIGGSHAQRDVFEQLLLVAGLRSDKKYHNRLSERMLAERDLFHGRRVPQTELLAQAA
ncbi:tetratricopeptide repeat 38 [Olea europaea subsp. europaea]|uniref:Tetratricopeptide repeat protein 38 n=1 Tax=Olea europaea subsp. europaea TaxID=158383 RepID=A0A8S0RB01_OLEEU|nr:tetratricopeptide repeat 38 [Olea europaea subsp. europaea]